MSAQLSLGVPCRAQVGRRPGRISALVSRDTLSGDNLERDSGSSGGTRLASVAPPALISPGHAVEEFALQRTIARHKTPLPGLSAERWSGEVMEDAYKRCAFVTGEYAKTFYLGTQLMVPEKARATWAIYVWCRRTDELVDGPNSNRITPQALDRWEA